MKIIHISDLHISSPNFEPIWGNRVIKQVNAMNPDILAISGDLIMDGYVHEYEMVGEYLKKLKVQNIIVVPGNHDARNEGYKIFEEVFSIQRRVLGAEHADTLRTRVNLGLAYSGQGRLAEEQKTYEEVLAIQRRVLGPKHPDTLRTVNNLGVVYQQLGELSRANPKQTVRPARPACLMRPASEPEAA